MRVSKGVRESCRVFLHRLRTTLDTNHPLPIILQDGDLSAASRWSCALKLGGECTISYDLRTAYDLDELRLGEGSIARRLLVVSFMGSIIPASAWIADTSIPSSYVERQFRVVHVL